MGKYYLLKQYLRLHLFLRERWERKGIQTQRRLLILLFSLYLLSSLVVWGSLLFA